MSTRNRRHAVAAGRRAADRHAEFRQAPAQLSALLNQLLGILNGLTGAAGVAGR